MTWLYHVPCSYGPHNIPISSTGLERWRDRGLSATDDLRRVRQAGPEHGRCCPCFSFEFVSWGNAVKETTFGVEGSHTRSAAVLVDEFDAGHFEGSPHCQVIGSRHGRLAVGQLGAGCFPLTSAVTL